MRWPAKRSNELVGPLKATSNAATRRCRRTIQLSAFILLASVNGLANADAWIPVAGHGKVKPVIRWYESDRAFSPTEYGTQTYPSSSHVTEIQLKVTGNHGLGRGWALQYDLRAAKLRKAKKHNTYNSSGLEDQTVGLAYGLRQTQSFADAVAFNVVFPTGSTSSNPQLGVGEYAIEPDYQMGITHRYNNHHRLTVGLTVGPRIFLDGGATQLRTTLGLGTNLSPKFSIYGSVFYVHTVAGYSPPNASSTNLVNTSEIYNLLRLGVAMQYRLSKNIRPVLGYEVDVAGRDIHAGHRIVLGLSWRY